MNNSKQSYRKYKGVQIIYMKSNTQLQYIIFRSCNRIKQLSFKLRHTIATLISDSSGIEKSPKHHF